LGQVKRQCEALTPALNVAEVKPRKGRKPDCCFLEPELPDQGGEQLPFVESVKLIILNNYFLPVYIINIYLFNQFNNNYF